MIRQVDRYYRNPKKNPPAELQNFFLELSFAKEFGWTPDQIRNIDYKWIQMYYTVQNRKHIVQETQAKANKIIQDFKNTTKKRK